MRESRLVAAGVWVLALVAIVFLLRAASQLLIPIVLAVLLSYALEPVVAAMQRRRVPRIAGAGVLLTLILASAAWGAYSLRDDTFQAFEALPEVARRTRELVSSRGASRAGQRVREAAEELQRPTQSPPGDASQAGLPTGTSGPQGSSGAASTVVSQWVQQGVGSILALAGHVTVIFFLVFFLLVSGSHFRQRITEVAGAQLRDRRVTREIIDDINGQIQRFLLVRLVTSAVVALATWAVLAWLGVQQAAVWGILAGVFNSIPYFGPVVVSGGLLLVGLVQFGDLMQAAKVSAAALAVTSLEGWLLTPPLMGKAEHMHPLVVFVGVLLWTWIWGAWGTILAVPMLVIVKSIADHVEPLKPVSRLMSP
jgi:predicted PurR-regulated permease PerM